MRVINNVRATVHRVIPEYDDGVIEVESAPLAIDVGLVERNLRVKNLDVIMGYCKSLQDELKEKGDVPAFRKAIELTAERRLEHRDGAVYIDGEKMPYKGLQLTE